MSEAVRKLLEAAKDVADWVNVRPNKHPYDAFKAMEAAIAAVEAELNAVPAVTDKQGFDGRSTDYPDWVENYR